MNNRFYLKYFVCLACLLLGSCSRQEDLADFTSDGCSLFPDSSLIGKTDWCKCCFEHDIAYWQGGIESKREEADQLFKECVLAKTGNKDFAGLVYNGVRFGGSPYFYNWYRWGYGWDYGRGYEPLTDAEKELVEKKLQLYMSEHDSEVCK